MNQFNQYHKNKKGSLIPVPQDQKCFWETSLKKFQNWTARLVSKDDKWVSDTSLAMFSV